MTNLNEKIRQNENDDSSLTLINETKVYVVREDKKDIKVFSSLSSAKSNILRMIGEIKDAFITSTWHLDVEWKDEYTCKIKYYTWFLGFIYYENFFKVFEIEEHYIFQ